MEDKRTQVLCSGLLIKSPTKHVKKGKFPKFWKLRWCVLSRITQVGSTNDTSKLTFCYYKDEESFRDEQSPLGVLTIDQDSEVRSRYKSQAGFDHLFSIKCQGKKFVKLSAPSCKLKSHWIVVLYYYSSFTKPKVTLPPRTSSMERRRRSDSGVKSRTSSQGSVDSGSYQLRRKGSKSSNDQSELPLPEDAVPVHRLSRTRSVLKYLERTISLIRGVTIEDEPENTGKATNERPGKQNDMVERRIYSDVFMLCEACQGHRNPAKEKSGSRKRSSTIKMENLRKYSNADIETRQSIDERTSSCHSYSILSSSLSYSDKDSAFSDSESLCDTGDRAYLEIDEKWLMKVREIMNNRTGDGESKTTEDSSETTSKDGSSTCSSVDDEEREDDFDDEEYMDMNVVQEEVKRLMLQSRLCGAVRANLNNTSENERVLFEMNL